MACHHRLLAAQTVERRQAWHAIIALGRQTLSNDVKRCMASQSLDSTTRLNDVGHDMPSTPLDNTHGRTTLGVACHHRLKAAHIVERHRAWIEITAFGLHARLDDVGRGMTSPPLDSTHGRQRRAWHDITALGQHTRSDYVGRGMKSPYLDSTHGRTKSGMA